MKKIVKVLISLVLFISMFGLFNTQSASAAASFIKPNDGVYTSYFGWRDLDGNASNGKEDFHNGVDIAKGSSLAIKSAAAGKVTRVSYHSGYGNYIVIRHTISGKVYDTLYAHLSSTGVSVGQTVSQGTAIGIMGNTGASMGVHLHFEVHPNGYGGDATTVDPLPYLNGNIEVAPPPVVAIPHTYDGTWATLRTVSPTGGSTINTFAHVGYGLKGTLSTGSLFRVYDKQTATNGTDYFNIGAGGTWIHRDNSEVKPYVATAKYTSATHATPGGAKIGSLDPGDSYKTYDVVKLENGVVWYKVGDIGWVNGSYVDVVRVP